MYQNTSYSIKILLEIAVWLRKKQSNQTKPKTRSCQIHLLGLCVSCISMVEEKDIEAMLQDIKAMLQDIEAML